MPSKSKSSKRHPSSDPPEPKSHPNRTSSNPIQDPPAPPPAKNPNPKSSKTPKPSSPTPVLPKTSSKSSDPMMLDDPSAASLSRKSDRKRKARDFDDLPPAAKSPQAGQRRLADDNAVALLRDAIVYCPECRTYLHPPRTWIRADLESKELLAFCLRRLKPLTIQPIPLLDHHP